ncbi:glutamine amidotransferase [Actinomycetospora sp. CA-053990]|uniref:glutamine amidotransferase n=1 Tax=Actinomycetospora sp. CA-053990 TaxID=3239891 RepID=UPI003D8B0224
MAADSEVGIAVLLPDLLDTYSDAGNAHVLAQRLRWRGLAARIVPVPSGAAPPTDCRLYLLGGGEDAAQDAAAGWLARHRAVLADAAEDAVVVAVCAGLQLLGHRTTDAAGVTREGLGLLDLTTRAAARRQVGEAVSRSGLPGVGRLTGFHNHRGVSRLGPGAWPLARRERGPANDPSGQDEGALSATAAQDPEGPGIVATYLHGPVLARNPLLADHLLRRAVGEPMPELDPGRLPDVAGLRRRYLGARD